MKIIKIFTKSILLICLLGLTASLGFYAWSFPAVKKTILLATTIQPETFTELYFENHRKLPSKVSPNTTESFSFTIHNLENQDMSYPYEVYLDLGNEKEFIDKKHITIKKNAYKTIQEQFSVNTVLSRNEIVVKLINKNQQIDFWIYGPNEK